MPRGENDDTARFMRAIAGFSAAPETVTRLGRALVQSGGALEAMLVEINETVLRRTLTFRTDAGATLSLDVSERRVLRVVDAPVSEDKRCASVVKRVLTAEDAKPLMRLLADCIPPDDQVYVVSALPDDPATAVFEGISVRDLMDVKAPQDTAAELPKRLADMVVQGKNNMRAMTCYADREALVRWGQNDLCAAADSILPSLLPDPGPSVTLWHGGLREDSALLVISTEGFVICAFCDAQDVSRCFGAWQAYISNPNHT
ncbi:hypothetical protein [Roseobacter weihaiensis]|uniref:hypothetical protein n=1 Tax=Roseobacter weihaiensis TaxID=2763262 RepID=UPI001D0B7626|nr:hypothetical protein [Roseobacter sp. H9]